MIFLKVLVNFVAIWELISNQINEQKRGLEAIDLDTEYKTAEGYAFSDWQIVARGTGSYQAALEQCKSFREELFQVEQDMNLTEIFETIEQTEIWTAIHKSKSDKVVDKYNFAPLSILGDVSIDITKIPDVAVSTETHVTLKWDKTANAFSYEPHSNSESKSIVCKSNLSFPYRKKDLSSLQTFWKTMKRDLKSVNETLEYEKELSLNYWNMLPKFETGSNVFLHKPPYDEKIVDVNFLSLDLQNEIQSLGMELKNDWKTFRTEIDVTTYGQKFELWKNKIWSLRNRIMDPVFHPMKLYSKEDSDEKQFDSANYRTTLVRIDESEVRIRFAKDFSLPVKSSLNTSDWQTVFTKGYWENEKEKLITRHFFLPSIYDFVFSFFSVTTLIVSCVNFCFSQRNVRKLKKTQKTQDLRIFKLRTREHMREQQQTSSVRAESPEPELEPAPEPEIRETREFVISPMYSRPVPQSQIIDIYPTTVARPKKVKKNNKNRSKKSRPMPPPGMPKPPRSATQEPLYEAESLLSLFDY
jgi:hypothetical protein